MTSTMNLVNFFKTINFKKKYPIIFKRTLYLTDVEQAAS